MPATFSFGKLQFEVSPGKDASGTRLDSESPFLLLLLADFTGRASRGIVEPLASRRLVRIDCDIFDQVMTGFPAEVRLEGGPTVRCQSVDDFHPDRLIELLPSLGALLRNRQRLQDPSTASAAMAELQGLLGAPATAPAPGTQSSGESSQETLARLMGKNSGTPVPPAKPAPAGIDLNTLIKNIVAPNITPASSPEHTATLAAVDLELSQQLRAILHHRGFQDVEGAWRALDRLVREFGGEENIQIWIADVSKAELAADLNASENLQQAGLFKLLREKPWAVAVGAFEFQADIDDLQLLGRIARIAGAVGAPFLGSASPHFVGCEPGALRPHPDEWTRSPAPDVREAWTALRVLPEAEFVGLTVPRVLMRLPYGKASEPIESFPFEELSGEGSHESFLWSGGAWVAAFVLAESFRADGWEFAVSGAGEVDDLPVYKFTRQGTTEVKPCAEEWLSERAGERVASEGLIPLLSIKGRGAVRLANLQSIAFPPAPLAVRGA